MGSTKPPRNRRGTAAKIPTIAPQVNDAVNPDAARLVEAIRELALIRSTAEDAAVGILAKAEDLMGRAGAGPRGAALCEGLTEIITACGFDDLIGQRAAKISSLLDTLLALRMCAPQGQMKQVRIIRQTRDDLPLNGPGIPGFSPNQDEIDALFAEA